MPTHTDLLPMSAGKRQQSVAVQNCCLPGRLARRRPAAMLAAVNEIPGSVPMATTAEVKPLIYRLPSIIERIDLAGLFPTSQPLEVEVGSGDGSFLAEYARLHPGHNFIGVERLLGRIRKLDRKGRRAGLTNLRGVRIESSYFLEYLLPLHAAAALHIYFPDPWPKRKHRRHRLINERFPGLARQAFPPPRDGRW